MHLKEIYKLIINELNEKAIKTQNDLANVKRKMAKKYKIACPSNIKLLKIYHNLLENKRIKKSESLENLLRKAKVRSLSGVVVVSVLTKAYPCPGKCIYCPIEEGIPKSYLSGEPAVERAKRFKFDPYRQFQGRIEMLKNQGHPTDKIELRIIGGSWSFYPQKYKIWFLTNCFAAANRKKRVLKKGVNWQILEKQQKINEKAKQRIVGISIETRPDLINKREILNLRKMGVTMVELGIQTTFDDILKKCKRGHGVKETTAATKLLKDTGFKILYQVMPNLPGSDLKKDLECFEKIFNDQNYKPDWLEIYPCLVCKGSELYQIWKKGEYKPYSEKELVELLIKVKEKLPYWVRIARLFRDIPSQKIKAGCKISNLREVIQKKMKRRKRVCYCIRCREIRRGYKPGEKVYLFRQDYKASDGREIFLSYENKKRNKLYSFLRLRVPSGRQHFISALREASLIREIQTFGQLVPISEIKIAPQHKGFGKKLIKIAEKITKEEFGLKKIAVISGVGVRDYWRKLGYKLKDSYMIKKM